MPDVPTADMPDRPTEGRPLLAATRDLWNGLHDAPHSLWLGSIMVLIVGGGLILASKIPSPFGWESHWPAELARDVGIALIIAPIVTIIYEAGTRRSAKIKEMSELINVTMASFITKDLWEEVKDQIFKRNRTRSNVDIKVTVLREIELADGRRQGLPDNVVVLEIEYAYDLLRFTADTQSIRAYHALDIHMWDEELQVPRFRWIEVAIKGSEPIRYDKGNNLHEFYNHEKGLFSIPVELPENGSAKIISNRYENIFVPGMYTLFMPEMLTRPEGATPDSPTIRLTIENLPDNLEATATTWYAPHELKHVKGTNEWSFKRPMFAGQGLGLIFKPKPPVKHETTKSDATSVVAPASGDEARPEPPANPVPESS